MLAPVNLVNDGPVRYRLADVDFYAAGDNQILLYGAGQHEARLVSADIARVLAQCEKFKTLDEHIVDAFEGAQLSRSSKARLQRELRRLSEDGFLLSDAYITQQLRTLVPPEEDVPTAVTTFCIPTRDRVDGLRRCLTSYINNFLEHGREVKIAVFDDSEDYRTRAACRKALRELKDGCNSQVYYAGVEEKQSFKAKLLQVNAFPEDVVDFALIGQKHSVVTTVGANRNAILLHTVGEAVLCVDDDTSCSIAMVPHAREGVAFAQRTNPVDVTFFPSRDALTRAVRFETRDVLSLHETWLQKHPSQVMAHGQLVDLNTLPAPLYTQLVSRRTKVRATLQGTIGDCSWDNPHFYLFQTGRTFERMVASEETYRMSQITREVAQAAARTTIAESANPFFAMCMGLDNTELLPPFTPLGRAEEIAFAAILDICFRDSLAVYLPWTVSHRPQKVRSFSMQHPFTIQLGGWLASCLNEFDLGHVSAAAERLRCLGSHLQNLATSAPARFEVFVKQHMLRTMATLVESIEARLNSDPHLPDFYRRDAKSYVSLLRRSAMTPVDTLYVSGGVITLQKQVRQYGRLLVFWPDIINATKQLKQQGVTLARPL